MSWGRDPETGARDSLQEAVATAVGIPSGVDSRPVVVAPSAAAVRAVVAAVDDDLPVRVVTTPEAWRSVTAAVDDDLAGAGDDETVSWRVSSVDAGVVTVARRATVTGIDTTPVGGVTVARVADAAAAARRYDSLWREATPLGEATEVDRVTSDPATGDAPAAADPDPDDPPHGDGGEVRL